MKKDNHASRRKFLQKIAATSMASAATPFASLAAREKAEERMLHYEQKISANDKIRIGRQHHGAPNRGLCRLGINGTRDVMGVK